MLEIHNENDFLASGLLTYNLYYMSEVEECTIFQKKIVHEHGAIH